jgi:hypothetical protein
MTAHRFPRVAALCASALLAAAPLAASAVDAAAIGKAPTSPEQPRPRTGQYKVVSHGRHVIRARCAEGGNVVVPAHAKATPSQRERDIREACKTLDYTK